MYKSDAQRKFFHANVGKKGITPEMVAEYDKASEGIILPKKSPKIIGARLPAYKRK